MADVDHPPSTAAVCWWPPVTAEKVPISESVGSRRRVGCPPWKAYQKGADTCLLQVDRYDSRLKHRPVQGFAGAARPPLFILGDPVGLAAVFIDVGYLFSGGSDLLFGSTQRRENLRLVRPDGLIAEIVSQAATALDDPALRVLRTYWYDGARNGVPAPEQVAIGSLPKVKLRLGRVTGSGQKGVDGLIIIDLLNLSTHRAVDIAIVFSGDEDLREAALFAQTHGVTVVLIGLPPTQRQRQSTLLIRESDHHIVLAPATMSRHLERVEVTIAPGAETLSPTAAEPGVVADGGSAGSIVDSSLESLLGVAEGVVGDRRFQAGGLIDPGPPQRLSKESDRLLVGRLAELTGVFPVDRELLQRVRRMCLDLAADAADPAPPK